MKGALAILGLVACATAFQYSIPTSRLYYGSNDDNSLLSTIYNKFHGPYNTQYYQRKFDNQGVRQYQGNYPSEIDDQETTQGLYDTFKTYGNKVYDGMYKQYAGKFQNYLKNYQGEDVTTYDQKYDHMTTKQGEHKYMTKKQQDINQLVKYINNPVYDKEFNQHEFDLEKASHLYQNEAFQNFMHLWENKMFLPKGEIFSIFNDVHVQQVKALFKIFYTAKDFETFYKTAVWARMNINEGMFLYTFHVAIAYRQDTQDVILPPIFEIYPQYFFNTEVMHKAYKFKMAHYGSERQQQGQNQVYTIRSNYSGYYMNLNPEQSLSYYLEDVGINAYYYYRNVYMPYWMDLKDVKIVTRRGEMFYYFHQQLLAKYYLERLSHGVGGIDYFNWDVPFETGYYPSLTYPNGLAFAERPNFANLQEYFQNYGQRWCFISKYGYGYTYVQTYEQRIREAIDLGFVYTRDGQKVDLYTPEGLNILGNIIEGNDDSVNTRYYGSYVNFARHLLGYAKQPLDNYKLAPSALEHFETSLRDPAFYKLFKKVTLLVQKYKHNLQPYTKQNLFYPGVKVQKVEMGPLVTFYDKFYADITNGLTVTPEEYQTDSTFKVKVEQYRLNHKNFNYKVYVDSDKDTKATVKLFIGPKYDEHGRTMDFYENRMNFVELDQFVYTLKKGQNVVVRNSREFAWFTGEETSFTTYYKNVMSTYGYPQRYLLPRGSEEGMTYQMYVIVYPFQAQYNMDGKMIENVEVTYNKYRSQIELINNNYPLGYPFDRPAEFEHVYFVPNAHITDVKIYHKVMNGQQRFENFDFINEEPKYFM